MKELLGTLPDMNKRVLGFIFHFLTMVKEHSAVNQMNESNLAIVSGKCVFLY